MTVKKTKDLLDVAPDEYPKAFSAKHHDDGTIWRLKCLTCNKRLQRPVNHLKAHLESHDKPKNTEEEPLKKKCKIEGLALAECPGIFEVKIYFLPASG